MLATGLPTKLRYVNLEKPCRGSRSVSSLRLFWLSMRVCRFGTCFGMDSEILDIRFSAHSSDCSRGESGKLLRIVMALSVKSMHSWSFATPKFSMLGILWPLRHL